MPLGLIVKHRPNVFEWHFYKRMIMILDLDRQEQSMDPFQKLGRTDIEVVADSGQTR